MKRTFVSVLCLIVGISVFAVNPKREMRATWLTTVNNIDWPQAISPALQQREMLRMLDSIQSLNMNTVLFQVRDCADAFYNSAYEPWSSFLKINRGQQPEYDPLAFVLEECHKRGLSCHAWMNPYRYSRTGAKWTGANDHPLNYENSHPDWLLYYSNNIILDPALPEVRQRIKDVVGDLLSKYDVDGIIFDDYFYPYGGTTTQDAASVEKYKPADMNVHDWRRDNVNRMVKAVYDTIQAVKPWVTFGISPFGIWTTDYSVAQKEDITLPVGITGGNMYQEIYCDPVAWLKEGTVDYISPQLYWKTGGSQDYAKLCPWWAKLANRFGVHFYSSMAVYKYAEKTDAAYTVAELQRQTNTNRSSSTDNAFGAVLYNTRAFVFDNAFRKEFKAKEFVYPALQPAINWKPAQEQPMVTDLALNGQTLTWKHPNAGKVHYAVYAVPNAFRNRASIFSTAEVLLGITYDTSFTLPGHITASSYKLAVSVLDGYNNEYSLRVYGEPEEQAVAAVLSQPADHQVFPDWHITFRWNAVPKADSYVLQIAKDAEFREILMTHEQTGTSFNSSARLNLKELGEYYWRVKVRKANTDDVWSAPRRLLVGDYDALPSLSPDFSVSVTDGTILIHNHAAAQTADVALYSLTGQTLYSQSLSLPVGQTALTLPVLPHGLYLLQIGATASKIRL